MVDLSKLDGRIGEGWSDQGLNAVHINCVVAQRGSPTAAAIVGALASPRPGINPFVACHTLNSPVRPITVVVNKTALATELLEQLTWGSAQVGIAQGILDWLAEASVDAEIVSDMVLLMALWIDAKADDATVVRDAAREAARLAVAKACDGVDAAAIDDLVRRREEANHPWYKGD